jgi:hypothetical protein
MNGDKIRDAALLYCKQVLTKTAYYLDCAQTDEGWSARVIVVEKRESQGAAGSKRWNMLYEVHLSPGYEALYHVRCGPWNKPLPATTAPEPVPAEVLSLLAGDAPDGPSEAPEFPRPSEATPSDTGAFPQVWAIPAPETGEPAVPADAPPVEALLHPSEAVVVSSIEESGLEDHEIHLLRAAGENLERAAGESPDGSPDKLETSLGPAHPHPGTQERQGPPLLRLRFALEDETKGGV